MKKLIVITIMLLIPVFCYAEITKTTEIGKIEVQENGVMNVSVITKITEDGVVISKKDNNVQYVPGQNVTSEDQKIKDMANVVWTEDVIAQYESDQTGEAITLDQQKTIKLKKLYANIKTFIETLPDGFPRYDADLKMNLMNVGMTAIAAGQAKPSYVASAETWIFTVQAEFVRLKTAILAVEVIEPDTEGMTEEEAATANAEALTTAEEELSAIDISISTLESKYGRSGTVLADPGVSTSDLMG